MFFSGTGVPPGLGKGRRTRRPMQLLLDSSSVESIAAETNHVSGCEFVSTLQCGTTKELSLSRLCRLLHGIPRTHRLCCKPLSLIVQVAQLSLLLTSSTMRPRDPATPIFAQKPSLVGDTCISRPRSASLSSVQRAEFQLAPAVNFSRQSMPKSSCYLTRSFHF